MATKAAIYVSEINKRLLGEENLHPKVRALFEFAINELRAGKIDFERVEGTKKKLIVVKKEDY